MRKLLATSQKILALIPLIFKPTDCKLCLWARLLVAVFIGHFALRPLAWLALICAVLLISFKLLVLWAEKYLAALEKKP